MKKKVKMTCVLKSGQVVRDQLRGDSEIIKVAEVIRKNVEDYFAEPDKYKRDAGVLVFGKTTILMSEIAAISFKD